LSSAEFAGETIAFWARRLAQLACPRCKAIGSLDADIYTYGALVYCVVHTCQYAQRHVERR